MTVDVIIEADLWNALPIETLATRACTATLDHLALNPEAWDIAVLACDDARIAELNGDFRDKPNATNVLSWPSMERGAKAEGTPPAAPEGDEELGDIAIAFETCMAEAKSGGIPPENHILHLLVHGTLHLLGYDHMRDGDADLMESVEVAILAKLGVPNPYDGTGAMGAIDDGKD